MFEKHDVAIINAVVLNRNIAMGECLNGEIQEIQPGAKGCRIF